MQPPRAFDHDFHPLEIFPFFRRWKPGPIRDVVYTAIWSAAIGAFFWVVGGMFRSRGLLLRDLAGSVLIALAIGYVLHVMFMLANRFGIDRKARALGAVFSVAYYVAMSTFGVLVGFTLVALAFDPYALGWILKPRWIVAMAVSSAIISILISAIFFAREKEWRAQAALEGERLRSERIEREAALATLRALQAQIEPHFLFNTLANVTSLVDSDPAKAKQMLESFNRFLRSSLAATRSDSTTLGAEKALLGAFLDVLSIRMGRRLRYAIEVDPALESFELPPMLLQPLVENAIRHGLESQVDGGEVRVRADRQGGHVVIEVSDTGVGFAPTTAGGLGLANVRDRLRLLFNGRAELVVGENRPTGARLTLRLPT